MLDIKIIRFATPVLAMTGILLTSLSDVSHAVLRRKVNDFRACAGRLVNVGITAEAASRNCARALRPNDLSLCVTKIKKQTQIESVNALSACSQSRRPEDLATCAIGISKTTPADTNVAILEYCGRSLLPVRFAKCVVGLKVEIDLSPNQAMETCIDASDRVTGVLPSFAPVSPPAPSTFQITPEVPAVEPEGQF
ncbi:MAG: hypothetical protein AAF378_06560 [Cyanobacteria bacterium P01_A01_bin.84]